MSTSQATHTGGQFTLAATIAASDGNVVTDTGTTAITLADLQVGQNVSAQGKLVDGVWTAARITAGAKIIHP